MPPAQAASDTAPSEATPSWGAANRRLARMVAIKAGLTAALAAWLGARWVPGDPLSVAFLSVICLQATPKAAWRLGLEQVGAALLGGASGLIAYELMGPLGLGPAVALAAWPAFRRHDPGLLAGAAFSALYLPLMPPPHDFNLLVQRMAAVLLGIGVAQLFNALAMPLLHPLDVAARRENAAKAVLPAWKTLSLALKQGDAAAARRAVENRAAHFQALNESKGALVDLSDGLKLEAMMALERVQALMVAHEAVMTLGLAYQQGQKSAQLGPAELNWPCLAGEALDAAIQVLEAMAKAPKLDNTELATLGAWQERLRAVDSAWPPPCDPKERLGPGLAMLVATQKLMESLLELGEKEKQLLLKQRH